MLKIKKGVMVRQETCYQSQYSGHCTDLNQLFCYLRVFFVDILDSKEMSYIKQSSVLGSEGRLRKLLL